MTEITLITGGCRSGKSGFALELANKSEGQKYFVATCPVFDEEMYQRILKHKKERKDIPWETVEEEFNLLNVFESGRLRKRSIVVIDCLSLWINNLLYRAEKEKAEIDETTIERNCSELVRCIRKSAAERVIFVSSEVGSGLVPENKIGRIYRDLLGTCNRTMAHNANSVYFMVSGIPLRIRENKFETKGKER
ncbi:bifunctional adenosylcobinamide kinase/adenosylcobinamide-phosphate guanylyltransferase [Leptospira alstonii]|uniref:Adenosylcobinamide kinase n=2 Tax=Leptospira alstonii TaxID=28452 RepID=M6D1W3_9LEPT|nr:bifunctional adenosylcobinamide kinase/adenosylcobinamide-phosphate guanylyltransferase [Leptospira alstonii]EMJ96686.1 putative bifunctional adenosylcobalamin biosynthesis protein CobP [Leptospira alstonii serovar Sichuan str. 79601]EQA78839.1 putative bifunctional adenosylcobalamin biosynthesis protein CobP [Leptospira alstonii serovar Pingchang str. 80-412]